VEYSSKEIIMANTTLALDISSNTGYAVLLDGGSLKTWGNLYNIKPAHDYGKHPWGYLKAAESIADKISSVVVQYNPNVIVIEETNGGSRSRFTQKLLEYIHCCTLQMLFKLGYENKVYYINTSDWRRATGIELTKEQKKQNTKLSKAKSKAGGTLTPAQKKTLGIKGRITKKHIAVISVNARYGLNFTQKDNDIAEAILLGIAYLGGVKTCEGK
jgi:hypothetical protein